MGRRMCGVLLGGLLAVFPLTAGRAMECVELPTGSLICDDGVKVYFRAAGTRHFVALDRATAYAIIDHFARQRRDAGTPADPPSPDQRPGARL